ncbi:MAG TPA: CPBP family intramembrane glutamic endopeptidase [Pyrinomonadaceae bacterium]|jgi:membrane protease YdiL (CAAX protease family)
MDSIREFLGRRVWIAFLFHQLLIFGLAFGFLNLVRAISGRTIHGGRDAVGFVDGIGLVLLSAGVIAFTIFFYRFVKDDADAPPLGIEISVRRLVEFLIGLLIGSVFIIAPYLIGFLSGRMFVADRITMHFDNFQAFQILAVAFFLLLAQSLTEETANRAFPIRLWQHRSLAFRLLVPSVFFALLHLADENLSSERLAILFVGGIIQSLAYLLTGNVWFTSGIHTGANAAAFSLTGLWHAGAVVALVGDAAYPNWLAVASMLVFIGGLFFVSRGKREMKE